MARYEPLHPGLYEWRDEHLDPRLVAAWRSVGPADTPNAPALAAEVHPGVHELRIMRDAWCSALVEELQHREAWARANGVTLARPNSMNEYGMVLDEIGFAPVMEALARRLAPLASRLFPAIGGATLDGIHAFVVEYAEGRDEDLGFHVDDSEVTLNLCLGEDFSGSELVFRGPRCDIHRQTPWRSDELYEHTHEPGVAVLHAGKHRHSVDPLLRGVRRNLILWCKSSAYRAAHDPGACSASCAWRGPLTA